MFEVAEDLGAQRWPQAAAATPDARTYASLHAYDANGSNTPRRIGRKRWFVLKFAVAAFVALTGAAAFNILTGTPLTQAFAWTKPGLDGWARTAGFGIDTVVLSGYKFTADGDIFDALDLPNARSLASFDTDGVRRRLERLPWIETADITRVYPDRLDVKVSERKAVAVWRRGSETLLIDKSGRVLTAVNRNSELGLPAVSGEGAATAANELFSELARYPDLKSKLDYAERISERRWTLHLANAITVHLPAGGEAAGLDALAEGGRLAKLLETANTIIDLRAPGRTAVRPQPVRAGES